MTTTLLPPGPRATDATSALRSARRTVARRRRLVLGACLLLAGDVAGRMVARPGELEVGIVTALIGAPFFIWLVRRRRAVAL